MKKIFLIFVFIWLGSPISWAQGQKIRVGHFPNITHAPVLIGRSQGLFEKTLGPDHQIDWKIFNAGSLAIEALTAGEIDILYVGPNPAVNGYVRTNGEILRFVSGVAGGGSAFVVSKQSGIQKFTDIQNKRIATPQIGNTQDVALRYLMKQSKLAPKSLGGNIEIFNISGGDQITTLYKGEIDGIWTVEPWVSRLVSEANGAILFEEKELWPDGQYATTVLVVRKKFLEEHPELVQQWIDQHVEIIDWMSAHPEEAKRITNEEIKRETGATLSDFYLNESFKRIVFTYDPMKYSVLESARRAQDIGFLGRRVVDLNQLFDLSFLEKSTQKSGDN